MPPSQVSLCVIPVCFVGYSLSILVGLVKISRVSSGLMIIGSGVDEFEVYGH